MRFIKWLEMAANFDQDEYDVHVNTSYAMDQPTLTIPGWGSIRLFYRGDHWTVHMIKGDRDGAGTLLYFAALLWVLTDGEEILKRTKNRVTGGALGSDSSLSLDAVRARTRMQTQYGEYIYMWKNEDIDDVKINRGDGSDWRRKAEPEESMMWRLKKMPPWKFNFI